MFSVDAVDHTVDIDERQRAPGLHRIGQVRDQQRFNTGVAQLPGKHLHIVGITCQPHAVQRTRGLDSRQWFPMPGKQSW